MFDKIVFCILFRSKGQNETATSSRTVSPTTSANATEEVEVRANIWEYEQTFKNQQELNDFMNGEKCWSALKTENLVKGIKTTYRCNKVKRRGIRCTSGIYTLKKHDVEEIKLFRLHAAHSCEESVNRVVPKVTDDLRNFILEQHKLGNPPATIMFKLREMKDKIVQPTKEHVNHIISYYKEKMPNPVVSIAEMEKFAQDHSAIPDDMDEGFVVNFECSPPRTPDGEKFFRIFYSTKRLLQYAAQFDLSHTDGTYKAMDHDSWYKGIHFWIWVSAMPINIFIYLGWQ